MVNRVTLVSKNHKLQCRCGRKILLIQNLFGKSQSAGFSAYCADCWLVNKNYERKNPVEVADLIAWRDAKE